MNKKRVALYCRVANADQWALDFQEQGLRRYAAEQGFEVVAMVSDTGSGLTLERPGIRALYEMAGRRAMDEVLSVSASRYARDLHLLRSFMENMKAADIDTATTKEGALNAFPFI